MASPKAITVGTESTAAKSIAEAITSLSVSHTMDIASSVQFTVHDKGFKMLRSNYFQLRREVWFRREIFEIASIEVSSGESGDPQVSVECFPRSVQKMKRDKKPRNYGSTSSYDYVKKIADQFNLYFVGQSTSKTQSIPQAKNEKTDESVWDVIKRLAEEAEFVCFVVSIPYEVKTKKEGVLFFISQKQLLKTWGPSRKKGTVRVNGKDVERNINYLPLSYPTPSTEKRYILLEMPSFRKSENDWREAEGSAVIWNDPAGNAQMIRPGMTVQVTNYSPDFNGYYIITSVEWSEDEPGPVKISFRTPEVPTKKTSGDGSSGSGSDSNTPTDEEVASKERQENLDFIGEYVGQEAVKAIVGKDDLYIADYVRRLKEAQADAAKPYTHWVEKKMDF